ncbi:hypothetical protein PFISCL1PPCAC_21335, partial [Pristionchus fissidentatus]
ARMHMSIKGPKDYSPEATKGAVVVIGLAKETKRQQMIDFLARVGSLKVFAWPLFNSVKNDFFAVCKYESNEETDRATRELTGRRVDGKRAFVTRAQYWMKHYDYR